MESKIEWHYLPEKPIKTCVVLISAIDEDGNYINIAVYSIKTNEYYRVVFNSDVIKNVYAWAYLPEPAEVK